MKLFAYGTLMQRHVMEALLGRRLPDPQPAVLPGFRKQDTCYGYPIAVPDPNGRVEGVLWEVRPEDWPILDHYEGVDEDPPSYFRQRVRVRMGRYWQEAMAYVGNPEAFAPGELLT